MGFNSFVKARTTRLYQEATTRKMWTSFVARGQGVSRMAAVFVGGRVYSPRAEMAFCIFASPPSVFRGVLVLSDR